MFESIVEALAYHAQRTPKKFCIIDEKNENTYHDIWRLTVKCTKALVECGIQKNDYIVVECTQDAKFLVCAFACQLMGALFVPVEHKATKERIDDILKETGAKIFLYANEITQWDVSENIVDFFEKLKKIDVEIALEGYCFGKLDDVTEVLYTTGTTGKPRGIMLTNGSNVAIAENIMYGTEMRENSVELIPLPISHSHGLRTCYADILNGSTIVLFDGVMNVKKIFEFMDKYQVTALDLSPNAAKVLLKLSKGNFQKYASQIDFIQIGTAMLDEALKEDLCRRFDKSRLYNFYGSTESGRVCVLDFNAERGKVGCIGKPAKHATFIVTDEKRNVIKSSKDNIGLIAIAGKMNMRQYMGDYARTKEVMRDGFVYTNDAGYIDEDGYVYVLGRNDDVINYRGIKIIPEEIESHVLQYEGVTDCACVAVEDKMCGQAPKVYISVNNEASFDTMKMLVFLAEFVEANKMPKMVEIIEKIPRTSNGKLLRRVLRER